VLDLFVSIPRSIFYVSLIKTHFETKHFNDTVGYFISKLVKSCCMIDSSMFITQPDKIRPVITRKIHPVGFVIENQVKLICNSMDTEQRIKNKSLNIYSSWILCAYFSCFHDWRPANIITNSLPGSLQLTCYAVRHHLMGVAVLEDNDGYLCSLSLEYL